MANGPLMRSALSSDGTVLSSSIYSHPWAIFNGKSLSRIPQEHPAWPPQPPAQISRHQYAERERHFDEPDSCTSCTTPTRGQNATLTACSQRVAATRLGILTRHFCQPACCHNSHHAQRTSLVYLHRAPGSPVHLTTAGAEAALLPITRVVSSTYLGRYRVNIALQYL